MGATAASACASGAPAPESAAGQAGKPAAAGHRDGDGDGIVEKDGAPLQATLATVKTSAAFAMMAEIMQAQLKAVGIRVDIRLVDSVPSLNQLMDAGDFDLGLSGLTTVPYGDPHFFLSIMFRGTGAWNRGTYANARVDELADQAGSTADPARRAQLACDVSKVVTEEAAYLWTGLPEGLRRHVQERRRVRAAPGRLALPGRQHRQAVVGADPLSVPARARSWRDRRIPA
jgi:hypothetical protein